MNAQISGNDVSGFEKPLFPMKIGGQAPGLLNEQNTGGNVPGFEMVFKEPVVASGSHVSKIQGRRTGAAQTGSFLHQLLEDAQVFPKVVKVAKRKARGNEAVVQVPPTADANPSIIAVCASAPAGREQFIAQGVVDNRMLQSLLAANANGNGKAWHPVNEIGGAIQGIDDPLIFPVGNSGSLFGKDTVLGIGTLNDLNDGRFRFLVHFRDKIMGTLGAHPYFVDAIDVAVNDVACLAGGTNGSDQYGMLHDDLGCKG